MVGPLNRDRWFICAVLVAALLVGTTTVPASAAEHDGSNTGRIILIERTGDAVVTQTNSTTYVWQSEQYSANVTFRINAPEGKYSACLVENSTGSEPNPLDCQSATVGNGSTATVELKGSNATETGERTLSFRLRRTFGSDVPTIDSRTINQTVITKQGDLDGDGLTNEFEAEKIRTDGWPKDAFDDPDMDSDGIDDGEEMNKWHTSPINKDSDGDSVPDGKEILNGMDPNDPDSDGDGVHDGKDPMPMNPKSATSTTKTTTPGKQGQTDGFSGMQLVLIGVVGVGVLGAVLLLWRASYDDPDPPVTVEAGDTTTTPVEPTDDEGDDILTDEGRVLKLLGDNRGRMKQVDIVEETGWSKSKVSRLLSRMEERGDVNRLRVGRGNIVYLDGAKPSGARSPHEEDSYS